MNIPICLCTCVCSMGYAHNNLSFAGKAATQKTKAELGAAKFGGGQTDQVVIPSYDPTNG
ncbi:hypothetical protein Godav_026079, partial [Gossypium davidsonii]|nr:hypothetical protein [Gossypium davidsonii]MBA0669514.1 hypothetical protein [Gossypium klotzschianum]